MTLSPEPGINRVRVSVEGLSQTVVFNAEGTVPLPEPMVDETEEMLSLNARVDDKPGYDTPHLNARAADKSRI